VIARVSKVTDKPIKYVLLTHYHAVRVLGAAAFKIATLYGSVSESVAKGRSLKDAFDFARLAMDRKFKAFTLYEHCLPFNVVRAYDEARGIEWPAIWTAERDREMWAALQG
jgi:glyoxylase-like metal-dependent hydrolase (beta-lactamase superfamily II)